MMSALLRFFVAASAVFAIASTTYAQTPLLEEVSTLSSGAAPIERSFDISQTGAYQLTLTDLRVPAPLTSVKVAVTQGTTLLGTTTATPGTPSAAFNFDVASAGTVVIRVVGKLPTASGSGNVGVRVTRVADAAVVQDFVSTLAAPAAPVDENRGIVDETFTAQAAGLYEVSLADLAIPQPLTGLILSVTRVGGGIVATLPNAGAMSTTFNVDAAADYKVVAIGESAVPLNAGLFSVRVRDTGSGANVLSRTVTIGRVQQLGKVTLAAGAHTLTLTDFQFPAGLSQVGAALSLDGQSDVALGASGSAPFTAVAGEYTVYGFASTGTTGNYGIEVKPSAGAVAFATVQTVSAPASGATPPAFSFTVDISAAGSYRAHLTDFEFPGALTAMQLAVAQSGTVLGTLSTAGTLELPNVAIGKLFLFVLAQPTGASGGALGVDVVPAAGGAAVFEATQGVNALFKSRKVTAASAVTYRASLTDVEFPKKFADLAAVITRGTQKLGVVLGSAHTDFDATPGNYFITFIATPDAAETAGTYGIRIADKPANPTVTLSSNVAQVTVGGTVNLTWSSTNATSCRASGAWSGSRAVSGTETSAAINAPVTFTLECTGEGGTTTQAVNVNAVAQNNNSGGGGGGGAFGWLTILGLLAAMISRFRPGRVTQHLKGVTKLQNCSGEL